MSPSIQQLRLTADLMEAREHAKRVLGIAYDLHVGKVRLILRSAAKREKVSVLSVALEAAKKVKDPTLIIAAALDEIEHVPMTGGAE